MNFVIENKDSNFTRSKYGFLLLLVKVMKLGTLKRFP